MTQPLYIRKWRLLIETWRGAVLEIGDPLRITFRIQKNINQIFQFAEIDIYNLSADTETDIFQNGKTVTLEAGYENGAYGVIFKGPIRQPVRGKEDATTYFLKLGCLDGDDALNLGFVSLSLASNVTPADIIRSVARSSTVPFDIEVNLADKGTQRTKRGKVIFGQPGDTIRTISKNLNAEFYFDNGSAHVKGLSVAPPDVVPEINAQSGMVGIPKQLDRGISVRCLINPSLTLDNWFKINNQSIVGAIPDLGQIQSLLDRDGVYRIVEMVVAGDSRGNEWYQDIVAYSQSGSLPPLLLGPNQSGTA